MTKPKDGADLIGAIYEAALDPELWPAVLGRLAGEIGAGSGALFVHDLNKPALDFFAGHAIDPAAAEAYGAYYIRTDVWNPILARLPARQLCLSQLLMDDRAFERTEFYGDFLRGLDIFYAVGGIAARHGSRAVQLGFQRSHRAGPFEFDDAAKLKPFFEHIGRAIAIHHRLNTERARAETKAATIEQMPFGVVLMDTALHVRVANRQAHRLIDAGDLLLRGGRIGLADETDAQRLADAIRAATDPAMPQSRSLTLSRGPGRSPIVIAVLPVTVRLALAVQAPSATVCLLIGDPERHGVELVPMLRELFALTPAEAQLAAALASGLSLYDAAAGLGIARETARGRLKVIFQKTGTGSQQELLRLMLAIPPAYPSVTEKALKPNCCAA